MKGDWIEAGYGIMYQNIGNLFPILGTLQAGSFGKFLNAESFTVSQ